jgi:hypothetical protein
MVCSTVSKAQDGPPPMAMPTENNKVLIDEVIKVTNYDTYFRDYCLKRVNQHATVNNWTTKKKEQVIKSIDFKSFSSTVYNQYAFHSTEELKKLIELFKELNKNKVQKLIVTSEMVQGNLELFVQSVIEGKYVM